MSQVEHAILTIASDIGRSPGWFSANYFHRHGVIDDSELKKLTDFDRLESNDVELTGLQQNARRLINRKILDTYSDLDLMCLGINVDDLTIAKNGWRRY